VIQLLLIVERSEDRDLVEVLEGSGRLLVAAGEHLTGRIDPVEARASPESPLTEDRSLRAAGRARPRVLSMPRSQGCRVCASCAITDNGKRVVDRSLTPSSCDLIRRSALLA
jgi:hypothetical protein